MLYICKNCKRRYFDEVAEELNYKCRKCDNHLRRVVIEDED